MANEISNEELKKLLLPDAKFKMDEFERMGLYALLYNEINGSKIDYGYTKQFSFDLFIRNKIKSIMQAVGSCYNHKYDNVSEADRKASIITEIKSQLQNSYYPKMGMETPSAAEIEKLAEETYGHAQRWLKNLMPLADVSMTKEGKDGKEEVVRDEAGNVVLDPEKIDANKNYLKAFVNDYNFDRSVSEFQRLGGPDKLSIDELRKFFSAKKTQVDSTFEIYRKNQNYKAGRVNEKGESKNGPHADNYFEARNKLRKMNEKIRKRAFKNFVAGLAVAGLAALSVVSAGALLSYGGFALTAMFGNAFSALGVGGAVAGAIGTGVGFFGAKNLYHRLRVGDKYFDIGLNEIKQWRRERKLYKGTRYRGKDLPSYIAEAVKKDPKNATYHELEAMYFYDKGMYEYYKNGGDLSKVSRKYRKYLDPKMLKEQGLDKDQIKYEKAWEKNGLFDRLENRFAEVVQKVEGKGEYTQSEAWGHVDRKLADTQSTISDVVELANFIDANTDKLTTRVANEKKLELANKTIGLVETIAFDNSYSSDTEKDLSSAISNSVTAELLKRTVDGESKANNTLKFIQNLRADTFAGGVLSDEVDASITNQVNIKAANMKDACSKYGIETEIEDPTRPGVMIPNPEYIAVQTACEKIGAISSKGAAEVSEVEVLMSSITNKKAKAYLTHMKTKKLAESTHNADSIAAEITERNTAAGAGSVIVLPPAIQNDIVSISDTTTPKAIENIKMAIMDPATGLSSESQSFALEMVQSQINAVERGKRNRAIEKVVPVVIQNNFDKYSEFMDKIPKDEDEINPSKLAIILKDFKKILPKEMSEFLVFKLKDKVASILKRNASTLNIMGGDDASAISKLQNFIYTIGLVEKQGIIDSWQKDECSKAVEEKIVSVFKNHLEILERQFLVKGNGETKGIVRNYLKKMDEAGFGEFLDSNTASANWLKGRLERIYVADNLRTLMTAEGKYGGVGTLVCANDTETQNTLRIYFQESREKGTDSYNLVELLEKMASISSSTEFDKNCPEYVVARNETPTEIKGNGTTTVKIKSFDPSKSYVASMCEFIEKLTPVKSGSDIVSYEFADGTTTRKLTVDDAMAIMLVAKKRTLSMLKSHMNLVYNAIASSGSPSEFANSLDYRNNINPNMVAAWQDLTRAIDNKVAEIRPFVNSDYKGYAGATRAMNDGLSQDKFSSYMRSEHMMS